MSRFNFTDYLRFKETTKLSQEIEQRKHDRNEQLNKAYGKRTPPSKINFNPFFYKKKMNPAAPLAKHPEPKRNNVLEQLPMSPVIKERNQFNIKIDTKKVNVNGAKFSKAPSHREYEKYKRTEYIYKPQIGIPAMGWIQKCILCNELTTSIEEIYPYKVYCCKRCQKKHTEKRKLRKASLIAIESNSYHLYQ